MKVEEFKVTGEEMKLKEIALRQLNLIRRLKEGEDPLDIADRMIHFALELQREGD
ncbi:MAG: hypothetical protein GWO20_04255 [Candidatus Korarchaeota archaeon]|nr:hypothetical protein [Candidatus Korarchaeota archaeon]NIU82615.1 hypothetical protein [Candidatus Thorarchaeota archaeon]NIW13100.1 hypothetical protein [Candidatus Thorarchaeota archaeon]NIW51268.1 hypothetical protein [Candidatus Korarchaeota archaeon]